MLGRLSIGWAVLSWLMVSVAAADASGTTPWRLVGEGFLGQGIGVSEAAVAWIVMAVCATVIAVLIRFSLGWMMHVVLLIPAVIAMVALPLASNAGQGPNHDYNTSLGIGFALAVGVLVDALLVRMTLTPAVMHLLGEGAWWMPRWLDRILPDLDVEGAALERPGTKGETTATAEGATAS